ncbi:MAG: AAA family ATPase [Myxococcota bacterium]
MRVIAVVNQKGGCGKTTTTVNLAASLAADGASVLAVDLDPQAHTTLALGVDPDELIDNVYEVLLDPEDTHHLSQVVVNVSERLDLVPSGIALSAIEQKLGAQATESPTERLAIALEKLPAPYDYVIIDCPPNVGMLTFNALRAASEVIIPLEMSFFAIDGVQKLLETIDLLSERIRHDLSVRILPTLYDGRTRFARETLQDIRELFGERCFDTVIRQNVKLREAVRRGLPVSHFAPATTGAIDYGALALEVEAGAPAELAIRDPMPFPETPPEREVELHFSDIGAVDVRIAGDFNGWVPDKNVRSRIDTTADIRVWTKILHLGPGTYQYRYVVDGEWCEDPENPRSVPGPTGQPNSILIVS